MGRLDGKVAIITGSTSGMGRDTAYLFAEEGAKVVIVGRREARAKEVVENIKSEGGEAMYVVADLAEDNQVKKVFDETIKAYGTVDILFNNAGAINYDSITDISVEDFNRIMKIDVTSYLELAQLCAPVMKEKGKGIIINTSSIASTSSRWGRFAYTTAKHAVNGITRAMARDLGPEIRVNAILPGAIRTEMLDDAGGEEALGFMKEMSPLNRLGDGREIGTVALFLATDDSSFITGQLIRVDGGVDC
ncbi:3-oxoacyl-ACP reductase [Peptoniphilus sp. ING2-D1G]|nr:3-oxoacyl-ACP reductase [Peptoniphilus sp. ING2-D1G]